MILPHPVPTDQLVSHNPPHSYGDCMRACLATLLARPAADVPHFGQQDDWVACANDYLATLNLSLVVMNFPNSKHLPVNMPSGTYFMLFGLNPNGVPHAVVAGYDGDSILLFHDPNPSRAGLRIGSVDGIALLTPRHSPSP